ncbi:MAG: sigma-70 family RNA polymerase sigma factor [Acidobacteria bacterium]|nr:sigma-70 family RNA polymerase sigma factor [Acidobacteriota bacterium]
MRDSTRTHNRAVRRQPEARAVAPSATPATDEEVVGRVLAGHQDAFETLVRRHNRAIYNYIYRMIGQADLAADLTQEVFLKVYMALSSFDPTYRFTTWLYRIASNRVIDHIRRQRMILVPLEPPAGETRGAPREVAAGARNPQENLLDRESARGVAEAIGDLPSEYRELIILRHFQHRSYEEIAQIKDSPLGTVKNRLFRAREALRRRVAR